MGNEKKNITQEGSMANGIEGESFVLKLNI